MKTILFPSLLCLVVATLVGCATTISTKNPQPASRTAVAKYTQEDVNRAVEKWMEGIQQFGPIATSTEPTMVGWCGTSTANSREHVDTILFQRAFEYYGIRTGKIRFTDAPNLPDNFFEQHKFQKSAIADKDSSVKIGKILGWKYSLYCDFISDKDYDEKNNAIKFYSVYVRMVNIETGEIVWNDRQQFELEIKRGVIGR